MNCLFCNIIDRKVHSDFLYESDQVIAFNDINPQAPIHQLIIPKQHIATLNDLTQEHYPLIGHLYEVAQYLAKKQHIAEKGYRVLMNCNSEAGQMIYHIHLHLLGGRLLQWPPG